MPNRKGSAVWEGGLTSGKGSFKGESGGIGGNYSFSSRFEEGAGSNPEELLAAAHAVDKQQPLATTQALQQVQTLVRQHVPYRPFDHRLDRDIAILTALIESGALAAFTS